MTNSHMHRGRVYRRCACRCAGKQLGAHCPELTSDARHGSWTFAVDMPSLTGKRATLQHNPARYAPLPSPTKPNLPCWTPTDAVTFLRHCAAVDEPLTELFEVLIGTGLRKGEALALHWADVHLDAAVLFVRYTLSNIRNTTPVMTAPKTKSSHAWVGLSSRVIAALNRQAHKQEMLGVTSDLVFSQPNGAPLRPESVLHRFHRLCAAAGVPRIRVHDLRHLAATLMISSQVPLALASKTLRRSRGQAEHPPLSALASAC